MNLFDVAILNYLNSFSGRSFYFDKIVTAIESWNLFKGFVLMALIWFVWFRNSDKDNKSLTRSHILATFIALLSALIFEILLQMYLPFRHRPIHVPELGFVTPSWFSRAVLETHSSFPSDQAVYFFVIAAGLWFISRMIGTLAFVYVLIIICMPRMYLGLHYPTDIICGALIGITFSWVFNAEKIRFFVSRPLFCILNKSPGLFYALSFFITYECAILFRDAEEIYSRMHNLFGHFLI
jgi:undecaprenyl-diphosphatase